MNVIRRKNPKARQQRLAQITAEVSEWPQWQQDFYHQIVSRGTGPVMAHMLASQQPPVCRTDSELMAGQNKIKDLPDGYRQMLCRALKKNGATFSIHDSYHGGPANFLGDPECLVGHGHGRSHMKRLCEKRGLKGSGVVDVDGTKCVEQKPLERVHQLHPRIVENIRQRMIDEDPGLAFQDQRELRESIIDKHALK